MGILGMFIVDAVCSLEGQEMQVQNFIWSLHGDNFKVHGIH